MHIYIPSMTQIRLKIKLKGQKGESLFIAFLFSLQSDFFQGSL